MKRNSTFFDSKTVLILYTSLVRPILEYNTPVWNPHLTCQSNKIENVQRKFVRYMCFKESIIRDNFTYSNLLTRFNMLSLFQRRQVNDILTVHKVLNKFDCDNILRCVNFHVPNNTRFRKLFTTNFHTSNYLKDLGLNRMLENCNRLNEVTDVDFAMQSILELKMKSIKFF